MRNLTVVALPNAKDPEFLEIFGPALQHDHVTVYGGEEAKANNVEPNALVVYWGTPHADVKSALDDFPTIEWVQLPSAGIEKYQEAMTAHPTKVWTTAKGAFAKPVGEHTLMLTLALLRLLPERLRAKTWGKPDGTSLHGLNVLITGAGGVSLEIMRLFRAFDVNITIVRRHGQDVPGADRTVAFAEFDRVLPEADVVILGSALTAETENMIGAEQLELMKSSALLINIGRGGLVDTDALVAALENNSIAGAGLDVTAPEPLPDGHRLWDLDNVIITPHSADTREMIAIPMRERLAANVKAFVHRTEYEGVADPLLGY